MTHHEASKVDGARWWRDADFFFLSFPKENTNRRKIWFFFYPRANQLFQLTGFSGYWRSCWHFYLLNCVRTSNEDNQSQSVPCFLLYVRILYFLNWFSIFTQVPNLKNCLQRSKWTMNWYRVDFCLFVCFFKDRRVGDLRQWCWHGITCDFFLYPVLVCAFIRWRRFFRFCLDFTTRSFPDMASPHNVRENAAEKRNKCDDDER